MSNARGYIGHEHSADVFDPNCWFDPETGEIKDPGSSSEDIRRLRGPAKAGAQRRLPEVHSKR
jgi:hypothetical protein